MAASRWTGEDEQGDIDTLASSPNSPHGLTTSNPMSAWPWVRPATVVTVFYGVVLALLLSTHAWDPEFFATRGPQWLRHYPTMQFPSDGLIFHELASHPAEAVRHLRAYRVNRILYPMIAWLLALGQSGLVAWTLVLVNLAAIALATELMHRLLERRGASPWNALAYGAWVGLGLALLHDTAEPATYLAALFGIWLIDRRRPVLASAAFLAALLGRETALLLCGPYLVAAGRGKRGPSRWLPAALVLGLWLMWLTVIALWLGRPFPSSGVLGFPFIGYRATRGADLPATLVFLLLPAVIVTVYAARHLAMRPDRAELWAALANGILVILLGPRVIGLLWHSGRVATGLVVASLLSVPLGHSSPKLGRALAMLYAASAVWTIAVAARYAFWDVIAFK
jgi:hypothetical protein